jgi:hypothetical protein
MKKIFWIILFSTSTVGVGFCQTIPDKFSQSQWVFSKDICTMKVGDTLKIQEVQNAGMEFKLIFYNHYSCKLKKSNGYSPCAVQLYGVEVKVVQKESGSSIVCYITIKNKEEKWYLRSVDGTYQSYLFYKFES